ncbi:hypothetical protein B0J18DRAFT_154738 [Chaetomium sp. MPI-SDFR-AT-0129]|nr:hypothetical protein B0J18DRAFT_154738 [Chaetomium sp. MPI-SDFR-AT-0129]
MMVWSSKPPACLTHGDGPNHLRTELPCVFGHASVPVSHSLFMTPSRSLMLSRRGPLVSVGEFFDHPPVGEVRHSIPKSECPEDTPKPSYGRPAQLPSVGRCFWSKISSHVLEHPWLSLSLEVGHLLAGKSPSEKGSYPVHGSHRPPWQRIFREEAFFELIRASPMSLAPASHPPQAPEASDSDIPLFSSAPAPCQGVMHEGRQGRYK